MTAPRSMRAAIIFNPESGRLRRLRTIVAATESSAGWQPTLWISTTDAGPVDGLVDQAVAASVDLVIAAGGDGTVRSAGAALAGRGLPFGIIPVGTANLLARNLGLPLRRLVTATRIAFSGAERPLDVATIDYELADGSEYSHDYFVMAGFGVDADMVTNTVALQKARFGWVAYVMPILRSLQRRPVDTVTYSLDGGATDTATVHSFIVANSGTITAGLRLIPEARLDDGQLDLLTMRSITGRDRSTLVRWLAPFNVPFPTKRMRRTDATAHAANSPGGTFHYAKAAAVSVSLEEPAVMQADGDLLGPVVRARFSVAAGALAVRAPAYDSAAVRAPKRLAIDIT